MNSQKKMKSFGYDAGGNWSRKQVKETFNKSNCNILSKNIDQNSKSFCKDVIQISPKKIKNLINRSNFKDLSSSSYNMLQNKQLLSVCQYSMMEKESQPKTKRKFSNTSCIKKKMSKNKCQIEDPMKKTIKNFDVLTDCLAQYIKQQKKIGRNSNDEVIQLIKAFNKSKVGPISKDVEMLIKKMLSYIENSINRNQQSVSSSLLKSLSKMTISYQQVHHFIPSKEQRRKKLKTENEEISKFQNQDHHFGNCKKKLDFSESQNKNDGKQQFQQINLEMQKQLQKDIALIKTQLLQLKSVGKKLQSHSEEKDKHIKKLQQIVSRNKRDIGNISYKKKLLPEEKLKGFCHS